MKTMISVLSAALIMSSGVRAEESDALDWAEVTTTEKGEIYWLNRKSISDSTHDGVPVKKATIRVTNIIGMADIDEFFGVFYLRCDPAGYRPLLAGFKRKDGRTAPVPPPPLNHFDPAPAGDPMRLVIEKACATL